MKNYLVLPSVLFFCVACGVTNFTGTKKSDRSKAAAESEDAEAKSKDLEKKEVENNGQETAKKNDSGNLCTVDDGSSCTVEDNNRRGPCYCIAPGENTAESQADYEQCMASLSDEQRLEQSRVQCAAPSAN